MGGVNRRTFLKSMGLALVAPMAVVEVVQHKTSFVMGEKRSSLFGPKVIEAVKGQYQEDVLFYIMVVNPDQFTALKMMTAKNEYKHAQWVIRYNRWRKKQGKPPYVLCEGEIGSWEA